MTVAPDLVLADLVSNSAKVNWRAMIFGARAGSVCAVDARLRLPREGRGATGEHDPKRHLTLGAPAAAVDHVAIQISDDLREELAHPITKAFLNLESHLAGAGRPRDGAAPRGSGYV